MLKKAMTISTAATVLAVMSAWAVPASADSFSITDSVSGSSGNDYDNDHDLKRYDSILFKPRDGDVTINGTLDLSPAQPNGTVLIGLVDAGLYDNSDDSMYSSTDSHYSDLASSYGTAAAATYQSGAYAYFTNADVAGPSSNNAGVTDGNNGAELVSDFTFFSDSSNINFAFTVSSNGNFKLTIDGVNTVSGNYGATKTRTSFDISDYPDDEFANGAYLAVDFSAGSDAASSTAKYTITSNDATAVPVPMSAGLALASVCGLGLMRRRRQPLV